MFGLVVVVITVFLAMLGPYIAPYHPERALPGAGLQPPSAEHWMGTDVSGMDVFSRVISAPRIDLAIALSATVIAFVGGVLLGVISGFYAGARGVPRVASEAIMRGADILQAFPVFIFALALVGFRGPGTENVIVALAFLNIPYFLRVTRGAVFQVRERPFVEAARCAGNKEVRIAFVHVMPNALGPRACQRLARHRLRHPADGGAEFRRRRRSEAHARMGIDDLHRCTQHDDGPMVDGAVPGPLRSAVTVLGYALVGDGIRDYMDPVNRR